jgi:hypothetical protein
MSELKDFIYLDTARLRSFVSQIGGGLVSQTNETKKEHGGLSAGVNVGIPPLGGKVDAGKQTDSERSQTLEPTDAAYFNALHSYLMSEKMLVKIDQLNLQQRKDLKAGQFVEIQGIAEPPVVENWLSRVKALLDFFEKNTRLFTQLSSQTQPKGKKQSNSLSTQQMIFFRRILSFLEDYIKISRKDPGKQFIRISTAEQNYYAWCGLIPDYFAANLEVILPTEVRTIGRIEKLLAENEMYKIVDLSNFNQPADMNKLLEALNGLNPLIGQKEIKEKDLQAEYPDIFVTPIAIYR